MTIGREKYDLLSRIETALEGQIEAERKYQNLLDRQGALEAVNQKLQAELDNVSFTSAADEMVAKTTDENLNALLIENQALKAELDEFKHPWRKMVSKNELDDMVNSPPHYTSHPSGIECIQITEHMSFNIGNAIKYLWRQGLKVDSIEDLKKAVWYIEREIVK